MPYIFSYFLFTVILIVTLVILIKQKRNRLIIALCSTFVMIIILIFPFNDKNDSFGIWENVHNGLESFYSSLQVFGADGQFITDEDTLKLSESLQNAFKPENQDAAEAAPPDQEPVQKTNGHIRFANLYRLTVDILYCLAPVLAGGFLLNYITPAKSTRKWLLTKAQEIYYFTEPSEKALAFAADIAATEKKICCIFCNVKKEDSERFFSKGYIPFQKSITDLDKKFFLRRPSVAFFISDNEERNMEDTLTFISKHKNEDFSMFLYTFSTLPEAELLLNSQETGKLVCRIVSEARSAVQNELLLHKEWFQFEEKNKEINILIVGFGSIGAELLKTLLWVCACKNRDLSIIVVDKEEKKDYFFRNCPGLHEGRNSIFDLYNIDLHFIQKDILTLNINESPGSFLFDNIRHVFIATGNDSRSLEYAIYLRQEFSRSRIINNKDPKTFINVPDIEVVMKNLNDRNLNLEDASSKKYNITPFLGEHGYYSVEILLNIDLEVRALEEHLVYEVRVNVNDYEKINDTDTKSDAFKSIAVELAKKYAIQNQQPDDPQIWENTIKEVIQRRYRIFLELESLKEASADIRTNGLIKSFHSTLANIIKNEPKIYTDFYKHDYKARSSRAKAIFSKIHKEQAPEIQDMNATEHIRWHAFMLSEGFQYDPLDNYPDAKGKSHIAKLHADMTKNISTDEKEKDDSVDQIMEKAKRILQI